MKKLFKKVKNGFTLVELVVVIAIIAILGSVSVVGYFAFIEKASKSADEQLCTQYNTILQATRVTDDDISLQEFILAIEENGINSNQFKTSSKSYNFAYDRANAKCVLLDKETGSIAYPTGYTTTSPLWSVIDSELTLQPGIQAYSLMGTLKLSSKLAFKFEPGYAANPVYDTYIFDLNNKLFTIDADPGYNLKLFNGTATVSAASKTKVSVYEQYASYKTTIIDKTDASQEGITVYNKDDNFDDILDKTTETNTAILSGKKIFNGKADDSDLQFTVNADNLGSSVTTLKIQNCEFENVHLKIGENADNTKLDVIIDNCKFYNNRDGYSVYAFCVNSFTFTNNQILNTKRGISVQLPKTFCKFDNNEFTMNALRTETHNERKDNGIQFTVQKANIDTYLTGSLPQGATRIEVTNNKIIKGQSLLTIHDGWVKELQTNSAELNKTDLNTSLYNKLKAIVDTPANFKILNNTLAAGTLKVNEDPGINDVGKGTTIQQLSDSEKTDYKYFVTKIESYF